MRIIFFTLFLSLAFLSKAQVDTVHIKTSAICEMCKETIERDMAFEKGVKRAVLDLETKVVTVSYNVKKTSPQAIREQIASLGYHADDMERDEKAHGRLPDCCQSKKGVSSQCEHGHEH